MVSRFDRRSLLAGSGVQGSEQTLGAGPSLPWADRAAWDVFGNPDLQNFNNPARPRGSGPTP
jgi:hypothetical protein